MIQKIKQPVSSVSWWRNRHVQDKAFRTFVFLLLLAGSITYLMPMLWMLSTSLKTELQVRMVNSPWIPNPVMWSNFRESIQLFPFFLYLRNSLITSILPVIGTLFSSTMVGYAFARLNWPGRNFMFMLVISTMMLPFWVTMIPVYVIWGKLKLINTFIPLVLPAFFGSAFFIFLTRQFFRSIPTDLTDAAILDGASHLGIIWNIIIPLSKPVLATIAVFEFMGSWNNLLGPVLYLNKPNLYTLMVGLTYFRSEHDTNWGYLMAASLLVLAPSLLIFFLGQRYFVRGITLTGIKG
jgi:ABC-type glycerol-3-phosphate transport system permease component